MRLLVTGAGGGIGSAVVRAALDAGHSVVAHGRRHETLAPAQALGATTIAGDITDPDHLSELARAALDGGTDAIVATHGITGAVAIPDLTTDRVRTIMETNTVSTMALADACGPALAASRGTFVATASQAGLRAERENSVYCASKWALVAWARSARPAQETRGFAIRVLCPGRTDAPMLREANRRIAAAQNQAVGDYEREVLAQLPLERIGSAAEMAAALLFLAGPAAAPRPTVLAVTGGEVPD